ncbi:MAG: hypothetical protein GX024_03080 [Clostridiales bacterium]|nr:hypothetical protein [Clostridiales bacterium]
MDEPVEIDVNIYAHPKTAMGEGLEFLTKRKIKVKIIEELGCPNEEYQKLSEEKLKKWICTRAK